MKPRYNKYHARKVGKYASQKEADRAAELKIMERAGIISGLKEQVPFVLSETKRGESPGIYKKGPSKGLPKPGPVIEKACYYVADFTYYDKQKGKFVVEDCKGYRTAEYIVKRKWMLDKHKIRIYET